MPPTHRPDFPMILFACGFWSSLVCQFGPASENPSQGKLEKRIGEQIKKLGDNDFGTREAAQKIIVEIGPKALPQLYKAARESKDPEIRRRAREAMRSVDKLAFKKLCLEEKLSDLKARLDKLQKDRAPGAGRGRANNASKQQLEGYREQIRSLEKRLNEVDN